MLISHEMIATAAEHGACRQALEWLRAEPRTIELLVAWRRDFACWALQIPGFSDLLTDEQLELCARYAPGYVLKYAGHRVSDGQLANLARFAPDELLQHACARLTDQQFRIVADRAPFAARMFAGERVDALILSERETTPDVPAA